MSNLGARWQRGTLSKRGDTWVVRVRQDVTTEDGELVRREKAHPVANCKDVRTRTQARVLADALVDKLTGRGLTAGASMLAADYFRRYLAEHVVAMKPASQTTVRSRILLYIIPGVGRQRIEQVTNRTAQKIVASMVGGGLHSTTIRDTVYRMARMMKQARLDGLAAQPIDVRSLSLPSKVEADVERSVFTEAEVVKLISGVAMPWRLAYALEATLGLRCAEVLGLAWRDFEGQTVTIRRSVVRGRIQSLKSKASAKRLAVPSEVLSMLDEYRQQWPENEHGLLFVTRNKRPMHSSWYLHKLAENLKRMGIPHRGTHAFRHFTASHLMRSGKSASATRDHLRHSNVAITNTYAHAVGSDLQEAANLMGGVITQGLKRAAQVAGDCGNHPSDQSGKQA
jgi:integrase